MELMNKEIAVAFNEVCKKYDIQRKELIPHMDMFYGTAADLVSLKDERGKILDLGAGTGLLTKYVFNKYPKAQYTLVDIADEMLDIARERYKECDNIIFKTVDYRNQLCGDNYDAIISALSIHHLDTDEKEKLYSNIFNALKTGGIFINADQVKGEDTESEEIVKSYQLSHIEKCNLSREDKDRTYERIKLDKMDTMSAQMNMLRKAGFTSVDIYYKYYNYIVFRAKK